MPFFDVFNLIDPSDVSESLSQVVGNLSDVSESLPQIVGSLSGVSESLPQVVGNHSDVSDSLPQVGGFRAGWFVAFFPLYHPKKIPSRPGCKKMLIRNK